jgi:hypothetical protein
MLQVVLKGDLDIAGALQVESVHSQRRQIALSKITEASAQQDWTRGGDPGNIDAIVGMHNLNRFVSMAVREPICWPGFMR